MNLVHRSRQGGLAAALTLALLAATALAVFAISPGAASGAAACPGFRVLHNDRIGPAAIPAGSYTITPAAGSGLTCAAASQLFARFLEDFDGNLPGGWRVTPQGSGKASFSRAGAPGFAVARSGGGEGEGGNPQLGRLCPGAFTVNATSVVGPLRFSKGRYLIYIPARSQISCRRASVLFTRFLAAPGATLPSPWRLLNQTATFYKPVNPQRSAFRIEPFAGT